MTAFPWFETPGTCGKPAPVAEVVQFSPHSQYLYVSVSVSTESYRESKDLPREIDPSDIIPYNTPHSKMKPGSVEVSSTIQAAERTTRLPWKRN